METPIDILDARLAKGEITREEYLALRETIARAGEPPVRRAWLPASYSPDKSRAPHPLGPIARILRLAILSSCMLAAAVQVLIISLAAKADKAAAAAAVDLMGGVSEDVLSQLQSLAGLILTVTFFYWMYRGTQNLERLGLPLVVRPAAAVGWWFVPIAFFWKPFVAVSQLRRASEYGADWIDKQPPKPLRAWWILFWVGLAFSLAILVSMSHVHRDSYSVKDAAVVGAVLSTIVELVNVAAMLLLYRIVGQTTEFHDARLPAPAAAPDAPAGGFSWSAAALGVLVFTGIAVKNGIFDFSATSRSRASSNWRIGSGADPINGATGVYAHGTPTALNGTSIPPTLIIECNGGKPLIAFDYKQPMQDAAPSGTLDYVHVILKADNDDPVQLTFVPSQDWTVLSQSKNGAVADGTAAVLNQIFGDFLPEAKGVKLSWDARVIVRAIGQSDTLVTRATARNNMSITATYDLAGFKDAYRAMPSSCH